MQHLFATRVVFLLLAPIAAAQSITGVVATAATVQATYGSQTQSTPLPVGPIGPAGSRHAQVGSVGNLALAHLNYGVDNTGAWPRFGLSQTLAVHGAGPAHASIGPGDFLLTLQAPAAVPAFFSVVGEVAMSGSVTFPLMTIDVHDDGTIDFVNAASLGAGVVLTIGPTGLPVRVRTQSDVLTQGSIISTLSITLRPTDTLANRIGFGCFYGDQMRVEGTFAGEVLLQRECFGSCNDLLWLPVIGFGIQPVVLPAPSPTCILFPSPDVVLFPGPAAFTIGFDVPASVRPITFWTQSVSLLLLGGGFATGAPFQVNAL